MHNLLINTDLTKDIIKRKLKIVFIDVSDTIFEPLMLASQYYTWFSHFLLITGKLFTTLNAQHNLIVKIYRHAQVEEM